jgi:hypothetical protein
MIGATEEIFIKKKKDKIMEKIKNWGIEFVLAKLIEHSWQHWKFFRLFALCNARVSALVIVLSDSPCEGIGKLDTCLILKEDRWLVRV